jgi:hypothetical protein
MRPYMAGTGIVISQEEGNFLRINLILPEKSPFYTRVLLRVNFIFNDLQTIANQRSIFKKDAGCKSVTVTKYVKHLKRLLIII